jgi:PAS domain S-box-containing protein
LEGCIIDCNKATLDIFGVEALEEVKGLNCLEFVAPRDILKAKADLSRCIYLGSLEKLEYDLISDYGRQFPARLSASVMEGLNGGPSGIVLFIEDISEVREMEESLISYNNVLDDYLKAGNDPLTKA